MNRLITSIILSTIVTVSLMGTCLADDTNCVINGTVFLDFNGNGTYDAGEPSITDGTVYAQADGQSTATAQNVSSDGAFSLAQLPEGSYTVWYEGAGLTSESTTFAMADDQICGLQEMRIAAEPQMMDEDDSDMVATQSPAPAPLTTTLPGTTTIPEVESTPQMAPAILMPIIIN